MDSFTFATFFTTSVVDINDSIPTNEDDGSGNPGVYCTIA
jgi:hypothetical protein